MFFILQLLSPRRITDESTKLSPQNLFIANKVKWKDSKYKIR
jgi:hypothetical protein